ncbi:asparaginase [Citricoccus sp. NR2]|uniref:asparaginase n=1 Tax=Citricoccus sp. NR2 TaxID=3004095 RepID=UPI0022DE140C|nr:asparaginase [Citricoccus sp. NR2]WBL20362.1 asparaginase [Citricoccus sp. NR2]
MTHVHLISTGGTIVSRNTGDGARATTSVDTLLADIDVEIETTADELVNVNSFRLTLRQLAELARAVDRACQDASVAGVVITHGTDTMEESAFLLDLVHRHPQPVILTGAQKGADRADTDGPQNLTDALVAAAHPRLRETGVSICFAGTVQSARGVRKAHTLDPSPFDGGTALATVVGDRVIRHGQVRRRSPLPLPHEGFGQIRVDVVDASVGSRPDQIPDAIRRGAHGVVILGTGAGNAPDGFVDAVQRATDQGVPVVLATRATHGPVVPIYGDGGGVDLVRAGAKPAGMLSPAQARVLLMLLISQGLTGPELHSAFTSSTF